LCSSSIRIIKKNKKMTRRVLYYLYDLLRITITGPGVRAVSTPLNFAGTL
jgi:hypothetical protein